MAFVENFFTNLWPYDKFIFKKYFNLSWDLNMNDKLVFLLRINFQSLKINNNESNKVKRNAKIVSKQLKW